MDNFCTPINQLGPDQQMQFERNNDTESRKKDPIPVQNYSDILKNINEPPVQKTRVPEFEEPPMKYTSPPEQPIYNQAHVQAAAEHAYRTQLHEQYNNHAVHSNARRPEKKEPSLQLNTEFQNDALSLLSVYFLLSSECVQSFVRGKVPSMVDATNKLNTLGVIINGIILVVAYNFAKKVIVKYIKDA